MRSRRSGIDWARLPLWSVVDQDGRYVLKVAETGVETATSRTERDRNVAITVHSTRNSRLIGYTLSCRRTANRPDVTGGPHYLGVFYSRLHDLERAGARTMSILYHDQHVRLLAFGTRPTVRDYLLVLRNRGD